MKIVEARPGDADALTEIALAAKRHWGYPENWIRRWEVALTITPAYIRMNPTCAAVAGGKILGFCALRLQSAEAWLDHLWVLPPAMGGGVGRALFTHAEQVARAAGAAHLKIEADPHAEGFYRHLGAEVVGREPAPMDGEARFLPLLEKIL